MLYIYKQTVGLINKHWENVIDLNFNLKKKNDFDNIFAYNIQIQIDGNCSESLGGKMKILNKNGYSVYIAQQDDRIPCILKVFSHINRNFNIRQAIKIAQNFFSDL